MIKEIMLAIKLDKTSFAGSKNGVKLFVSPGDKSVQITAIYEQITLIYNVPKEETKEIRELLGNILKHKFESKYLQEGEEE